MPRAIPKPVDKPEEVASTLCAKATPPRGKWRDPRANGPAQRRRRRRGSDSRPLRICFRLPFGSRPSADPRPPPRRRPGEAMQASVDH